MRFDFNLATFVVGLLSLVGVILNIVLKEKKENYKMKSLALNKKLEI